MLVITFFLMPKVTITVTSRSIGWHSQSDVRVKSDSSFYSVFLFCILYGTHVVYLCSCLESCVCWMCVIHDYFSVAPLEVMPFDNMALGWQENRLRSLLLLNDFILLE